MFEKTEEVISRKLNHYKQYIDENKMFIYFRLISVVSNYLSLIVDYIMCIFLEYSLFKLIVGLINGESALYTSLSRSELIQYLNAFRHFSITLLFITMVYIAIMQRIIKQKGNYIYYLTQFFHYMPIAIMCFLYITEATLEGSVYKQMIFYSVLVITYHILIKFNSFANEKLEI